MAAGKQFLKGLMDNPNFQKWFGESAVRDAEGLPLEVYHGTRRNFTEFDTAKNGTAHDSGFHGDGVYFAKTGSHASDYAGGMDGASVIPGFVSIENPYIKPSRRKHGADAKSLYQADIDRMGGLPVSAQDDPQAYAKELTALLKKNGHDGLILDTGNPDLDEIVAFSPTQFKSRFNQGTFDPSDPNFLKSAGLMTAGAGAAAYGMSPDDAEAMSYIGPKGLAGLMGPDAAKKLLTDAEQMAAKGVDNEAIRQATGVFKGMDGKWRYEVDDTASQALRPQYPPNFMNQAAKEAGFGSYVDIPMADRKPINVRADQLKTEYVDPFSSFSAMSNHMRHDDLYKAYPDLADAPTRVDSKAKHQGVAYSDGRIEYGGGTISGGGDRPTLLHELQHAIQQREGFAVGGSPSAMSWASPSQRPDLIKVAQQTLDEWKPASYEQFWGKEVTPEGQAAYADYLKGFNSKEQKDVRWKAAQQGAPGRIYQDLAGEIEARDVSKRMNYTPEQRRATPPDLRDNAIVRFDQNAPQEAPGMMGYNAPPRFSVDPKRVAKEAITEAYSPIDMLVAGLSGGGGLMARLGQAAIDPVVEAGMEYLPKVADTINPRNIIQGLMR